MFVSPILFNSCNFPIFNFSRLISELNRIDLVFLSALCAGILPIYTDRFSCRYVTRPYNEVALSCIDDSHTLFSVIRRVCRGVRTVYYDRINTSAQNTFDSLDFTAARIKALIYFARGIRAIEFGK